MKTMNRIIMLTCAFVLCAATVANASGIVGLKNFKKDGSYQNNVFSDVTEDKWYYDNVASVYEYGLMNGTGSNQFNPDGRITLAETITLAARLHGIYYHGVFPEAYGEEETAAPWYQTYVTYAADAGITARTYSDYNVPATRAEFAAILSRSIDPLDLEEMNWIDDDAIPDVSKNADYTQAVYCLYRAGILTGSDSAGTFHPNTTISRAEAAAIITRIVDPSLRKTIELFGEY